MSKTNNDKGNSNMLKGVLMLCIAGLIGYILLYKVDALFLCPHPNTEWYEFWKIPQNFSYDILCFVEVFMVKIGLIAIGLYAIFKGIKNIGD